MANTVNGIATGSLVDANRETTGIIPAKYRRVHRGEVLRARCAFDGAGGDMSIDSPIVGTIQTSGLRIYIVGLEYGETNSTTLIIKSKVGASTAIELGKFELAANGGVLLPIKGDHCMSPTDQSGVLQMNVNAAVNILLHYIIADGAIFE